jgi:hypothetical protein
MTKLLFPAQRGKKLHGYIKSITGKLKPWG